MLFDFKKILNIKKYKKKWKRKRLAAYDCCLINFNKKGCVFSIYNKLVEIQLTKFAMLSVVC